MQGMYQVIKRDGKIAEFDISKIASAVKQAFEACEKQYNDKLHSLQKTARKASQYEIDNS